VTIRCNVSNPCQHINFINVRTNKWDIGQKQYGYVCEYASGIGEGNVPQIHCLDEKKSVGPLLKRESDSDKEEQGKVKNSFQSEFGELSRKEYLVLLDELERAAHEVGYF
jgi:hypothetical protein